jgi:hypothetical protein
MEVGCYFMCTNYHVQARAAWHVIALDLCKKIHDYSTSEKILLPLYLYDYASIAENDMDH